METLRHIIIMVAMFMGAGLWSYAVDATFHLRCGVGEIVVQKMQRDRSGEWTKHQACERVDESRVIHLRRRADGRIVEVRP